MTNLIYDPAKIGMGTSPTSLSCFYEGNYFKVDLIVGENQITESSFKVLKELLASEWKFFSPAITFKDVEPEPNIPNADLLVDSEGQTETEETVAPTPFTTKQLADLMLLPVREADPIIAELTDVELLNAWLEQDDRVSIKDAINTRLRKLAAISA